MRMKTILISLMLLAAALPVALADHIVVSQIGGADSLEVSGAKNLSQSFTIKNDTNLTAIIVNLQKKTNVGAANFTIFTDNGSGHPNTSNIALGPYLITNVNAKANYTINLTPTGNLTTGVYHLVMRDAGNNTKWTANSAGPYLLGNLSEQITATHPGWQLFGGSPNYDAYFILYGSDQPVPTINNCTPTNQYRKINITIINETGAANNTLNAELHMSVTYITPDYPEKVYKNNLTWSNNGNYGFCTNNVGLTITNAQMTYYNATTGYATKTYYLYNQELSGTEQRLDLYLTAGTTQTAFQVLDQNYQAVSGALIKVLSYDLGTDTSKTTEIIKTDSLGTAYAQIIRDTQYYRFIIMVDGETKLVSNPTLITSSPNQFRITTGAGALSTTGVVTNTTTNLVYNNNTRKWTYYWNNPSGGVERACLEIKEYRARTEGTVINSTCVAASAGTITLGIGVPVNNYRYTAEGTLNINPTILAEFDEAWYDEEYATWGQAGLLATFMVVTTAMLAGLVAPPLTIILGVISIALMVVLGLFKLGTAALTLLIIGGIFIVYKISRNEG